LLSTANRKQEKDLSSTIDAFAWKLIKTGISRDIKERQ
jgi:hypothetical protein